MPRYRFDIEQRSDKWRQEKLGKFSGSDFHVMLGDSQAKKDFLWEKFAEIKYQDSDREDYKSLYMERGTLLEPEARRMYNVINDVVVKEVGLVEDDGEFDGYAVCSPDGLVGEDGIIEIKCLVAKYHEQYTNPSSKKYGYIKPEYKTQVQYNLFITGRKWCDFVYYHPRSGCHIIRIERDEEYINKIKDALREGKIWLQEKTGVNTDDTFSINADNQEN